MKPGTIFAPSTTIGKAGIAVIRVSGELATHSLKSFSLKIPTPRVATKAKIIEPTSQDEIDEAIVLFFPKPNSFTGEDVVEYQIHGGRAVINALLETLGSLPGLRLAEPGEFSRRAFENGKMDLTEVEGLADIIDAETLIQSKQAARQLGGKLKTILSNWRESAIAISSDFAALIDFSDEDLPPSVLKEVKVKVKNLTGEIQTHLSHSERGERIRDGIHIALLGEPNVGKSSLLNALVERDAAIVSEVAGTTRDLIEVYISLAGYPVVFFDTAGIRDEACGVEAEGVKRALEKAQNVDLRLLILDCTKRINKKAIDNKIRKLGPSILVWNKIDLLAAPQIMDNCKNKVATSASTGEGIEALLKAIEGFIQQKFGLLDATTITRARHRDALKECLRCLKRVFAQNGEIIDIELAAEELRLASHELGRLTGNVNVEDLLDKIFSDFCIGK